MRIKFSKSVHSFEVMNFFFLGSLSQLLWRYSSVTKANSANCSYECCGEEERGRRCWRRRGRRRNENFRNLSLGEVLIFFHFKLRLCCAASKIKLHLVSEIPQNRVLLWKTLQKVENVQLLFHIENDALKWKFWENI